MAGKSANRPQTRDMYSALAIRVMKERTSQVNPENPVLADLVAERRAAAERRLQAERDPAQREALRQADAERQAEAELIGQRLQDMLRPMRAMRDIVGRAAQAVTRMVDRMTALGRWVDEQRAARVARLTAHLNIIVSTLTLIVQRQTADALHLTNGRITSEAKPLLDEHVHSLLAAPRPGPLPWVAPAAA